MKMKNEFFIFHNKMIKSTHFANMLLSKDFPLGRMHAPKRKKGDWFHSVAVFSNKNIHELTIGSTIYNCNIIHFHGNCGSPQLDFIYSDITCMSNHMGKKIYSISSWDDTFSVIGDVRTTEGYEKGYGSTNVKIRNIISVANEKWGKCVIPYSHQRSEAYNCVAFVDDILHWCLKGEWSERITKAHKVHGLYI